MATTTINDLPMSRALDHKAMSSIKGAGGAPWVFGAFRPFVPESARFAPIVNFFQTNNTFVADVPISIPHKIAIACSIL